MIFDLHYIGFIKEIDPAFKEHRFKLWCQQVLFDIQDAWSKKDKEILKKYEVKQLYDLHTSQLDAMTVQNIRNVTKEMTIDDVLITDFKVTKEEELITVILPVSLIDYYEEIIPNSKNGYLKKGSKDTKVNAQYTIVFTRPKNFQSSSLVNEEIENCPNCGAPINIQEQEQCAYCDTPFITMNSTYKIKSLKI